MGNNIKAIRKKAGLTQQEVADRIGIHWTNFNHLENGKTDMTVSRLFEVAEALGCDPQAILFDRTPNIRLVPVNMHVEAGTWAESHEWDPDDRYMVAVPDDADLRGQTLYAAETRGPSMNKRWDEGTVVVYTSVIDNEKDIILGKRYIVEWERADGLREATVKTLWRDDDGKFWLLPESNDPRHQTPIPIDGNEGDTIRLVGRVVWAASRE